MKPSSRFISVPFSFWSWHYYPNAPTEVKFLSLRHPHEFKCRVEIEVQHNDRELEFYLVRDYLQEHFVDEQRASSTSASCEMFCDKIADVVNKKWPGRIFQVEVSEDGIYSAKCNYDLDV